MTELVLICFTCGAHLPPGTPAYSGVRSERDRRGRWTKHDDHLVKCPRSDNENIHAPESGWNWHSKARARGREWLRVQRALARHEALRAKEVKAE